MGKGHINQSQRAEGRRLNWDIPVYTKRTWYQTMSSEVILKFDSPELEVSRQTSLVNSLEPATYCMIHCCRVNFEAPTHSLVTTDVFLQQSDGCLLACQSNKVVLCLHSSQCWGFPFFRHIWETAPSHSI